MRMKMGPEKNERKIKNKREWKKNQRRTRENISTEGTKEQNIIKKQEQKKKN